jgi:hypothetical protein
VPEVLARVKEGVLVQLPRQEFEEKVRRALLPLESAKNPPRLVEARYRATLMSESLVGTAEWKMINPGSVAGVLPLQPFNLALVKARLRKGELDAAEAVLGELGDKRLGLLLEQSGEQVANLNWSARGELGPSGLHFDLQVPACPVASLELDLPIDMIVMPSGRDTHLLTGPLVTANESRSLWRLNFAGQSRVDLILRARAADERRHPPLILAQVESAYDLGPEFVQADFEFKLEIPRQQLRKPLEFELDPVLQPIEVRTSNLESWESPSSSKLMVHLKEPFQGGSVVVRCLARLGPDKTWSCPACRLRDAIPRGESVTFRIPANVRLEDWQSADFRLTGNDLLADGRQVLSLTAANLNEGGKPKRPSTRVSFPAPKFRVKQLTWWQIGPKRSTLMAQFLYEIVTGQLFQLPLSLPAGWEVDKVELFPAELMRNWTVVEEQGQRTLMVEFQRPLTPSSSLALGPIPKLLPRLGIWLRPALAGVGFPFNTPMPLPDIVPSGVELREGHLAISVDPLLQARIQASAAQEKPEEKGPWGRQNPDFYFSFQGHGIEGTLLIQPRPPQITARCRTDVVVTPNHLAMAIRLVLQPQAIARDTIIFSLSTPVSQLADWQTKEGSIRVRQARRLWEAELATPLAALGAPTILHELNCLAAQSSSNQTWLLTFDRPLNEKVSLETTLHIAAIEQASQRRQNPAIPNAEQFWDVPVPAVLGVNSMEGEVAVCRAGLERFDVEAKGMLPSGSDPGSEPESSWRIFRYEAQPVALKLRCQVDKATAEPIADPVRADYVRLTTYLESPTRLVNYFSFRLINWPQPTIPIRLSRGARLIGATVNGNWLPQARWEETSEGDVSLELPVPAAPSRPYYQITYSTDVTGGGLWYRVKAPFPDLPVQRTLGRRRTWCLPPGLAPLDEGCLRASPPATGERALRARLRNPFQLRPLSLGGGEEWINSQRQAIVEAGQRLRNDLESESSITLAKAFQRMAFDYLKDRTSLVLDVRAFREARLSPVSTMVSGKNRFPFPWEELGIIYVPCESAALLTTRCQSRAWNAEGSPFPSLVLSPTRGRREGSGPKALTIAVGEAAIFGHDSSGRFRTVADWISGDFPGEGSSIEEKGPTIAPAAFDPPFSILASFSFSEPGWTEWELLAGSDVNEGLVVVHRDVLIKLSFYLSLVLLFAVWRVRNSGIWTVRLLLMAWLVGGSLALIWLPAPLDELAKWPALTGWIVTLFRFLTWSVSPIPPPAGVRRHGRGLGGLAAIGSAVFGILGMPGHAAAPTPPTVYIVPGPAEAPAQQTVLASPEVLDHLRDLGEGVLSPRRRPILLSARYQGTVAEETANFEAHFEVHSFGDGPFNFSIPLGPITLRDALLDGVPANPTVTPSVPGQSPEGYSLVIGHRGTHSIDLRFTVPIQAAGEIAKVQFRIPESAMSRLTLEALPDSSFPYAVAAKGAQRLVPHHPPSPVGGGPGGGDKRLRLEADLGQTNSLHVHWRKEAPKAGTVRVREAYLWDLRPYTSSLFAFLQYTVSQGGVTNLVLNVPEQLEVRNDPVVVRDFADNSSDSPPRLKDWYWAETTGSQRRLVLEFLRPLTGTVQVTVEFVPRTPLGPDLEVFLPTPQDVQASAEKGTEHFLAYRSQGLESQLVANLRVTGVDPDTFRNWWASSGLADPGADFHAFGFQREPGGPPLLRLKLTPLKTAATGLLNVAWRLRKNQAELQAMAKLNSSSGELGLVEWEVPLELGIISVSGPQVRNWSRTGSRLQVWLKGLITETTLQLTGWMPLGPVGEGQGEKPVTFRLLPLSMTPVDSLTTFVRLEADRNLVLEPVALNHLLSLPSSIASEREFSYVIDQNDYGGEFRIRSSPPPVQGAAPLSLPLLDIVNPQAASNAPEEKPQAKATALLHPQVLLADQEAAVVDSLHWEYQSRYWINPGLGNDLTIQLPNGATILEVANERDAASAFSAPGPQNEMAISPLPLAAGRWWVPLEGRSGQILRLRWIYPGADQPIGQPRLESPTLKGLPDFPTLWTVHVPPGFAIARSPVLSQEVTAAAKFLHAAESQLQLSLWLSKQGLGADRREVSNQLRTAQERFYRYCGLAEHWLANVTRQQAPSPSDAVLHEIRDRNRKQATAQGFEKIRQGAEEAARRNPLGLGGFNENEPASFLAATLTDQGTPTYWFATSGGPAPRLHLTTQWQRRFAIATRATILVMVVFLAGIIIYCVPKTRTLVRTFGPELIVLLGCLGWLWTGPDWSYFGVIGLGVFGRLFWLVGKLRTRRALVRAG